LRALITRPEHDSAALADALRARGVAPVIEPMMTITPPATAPDPDPGLDGVQAVLLTSANGARAVAEYTERRDVPVFAVGDATAAAARGLGFAAVDSAAGDVAALAALVRDRLRPAAGVLLHPAGSAVAGDLAGALAADGFTVRRIVLYRTQPSGAISPATCRLLADGSIAAALFFSPRTAQTFVTLAGQARLAAACAGMAAFCLSQAVANRLQGLDWRSMHIARTPEADALLAAFDAWASHMKPER
jgi:uroporphyrinogen-III synthase